MIKMRVPRGMLFIYDQKSRGIIIPQYDPTACVSQSENAISIAVLAEEEGEVSVNFCVPENKTELFKIFDGSIKTQSSSVDVCVMGDESINRLSIEKEVADILVYANEAMFPDRLYIIAR